MAYFCFQFRKLKAAYPDCKQRYLTNKRETSSRSDAGLGVLGWLHITHDWHFWNSLFATLHNPGHTTSTFHVYVILTLKPGDFSLGEKSLQEKSLSYGNVPSSYKELTLQYIF